MFENSFSSNHNREVSIVLVSRMNCRLISIILIFLCLFVAISGVSAFNMDDNVAEDNNLNNNSDMLLGNSNDDVTVGDDGSLDLNFTELQNKIDTELGMITVTGNVVKKEGESEIIINKSVIMMGGSGDSVIDANHLGGIFNITGGGH